MADLVHRRVPTDRQRPRLLLRALDDLKAQQDVADRGNADHRDMGHGVTGAAPAARHLALGAAASSSAMLPDMIVRTCSVMCSAGQSHQATASSRAMSCSS